jgi:hypothetical protein
MVLRVCHHLILRALLVKLLHNLLDFLSSSKVILYVEGHMIALMSVKKYRDSMVIANNGGLSEEQGCSILLLLRVQRQDDSNKR